MSGIVLLEGVSFVNKGAELMLAAVAERMQRAGIEVAAHPHIGPFRERARYGLLQAFDRQSLGRLGTVFQTVMRPGYRRNFGLVGPRDIDAVLDASGFFLGDQWQRRLPYGRKLKRFHRFKQANKPIIMLPQAFGPFNTPSMAAVAREFVASADLVYARDDVSLAHLQSLIPDHPGIKLAPDFTALLDGYESHPVPLGAAPAAVIPNNQMLVHGMIGKDRYFRFLADAVQLLRKRGLDVFLLLHESRRDRSLAAELRSTLGELTVIEEPDPRAIKSIIGRCVVTVGSRFHGLVSALSQGIPAIGTGWSHKYVALFNDYHCSECLIDLRSGGDGIESVVSTLLEQYETRKSNLLKSASEIRDRVRAMWMEIDQIVTRPAT